MPSLSRPIEAPSCVQPCFGFGGLIRGERSTVSRTPVHAWINSKRHPAVRAGACLELELPHQIQRRCHTNRRVAESVRIVKLGPGSPLRTRHRQGRVAAGEPLFPSRRQRLPDRSLQKTNFDQVNRALWPRLPTPPPIEEREHRRALGLEAQKLISQFPGVRRMRALSQLRILDMAVICVGEIG